MARKPSITWDDAVLTAVDVAAISACREGRWPTANEVADSIELGRACNDHPDTPRRVYPARRPISSEIARG